MKLLRNQAIQIVVLGATFENSVKQQEKFPYYLSISW